jgi:hypothetical protein
MGPFSACFEFGSRYAYQLLSLEKLALLRMTHSVLTKISAACDAMMASHLQLTCEIREPTDVCCDCNIKDGQNCYEARVLMIALFVYLERQTDELRYLVYLSIFRYLCIRMYVGRSIQNEKGEPSQTI